VRAAMALGCGASFAKLILIIVNIVFLVRFIYYAPTLRVRFGTARNFDLFRTCTSIVSALLRGNWEDFN